MAGKNNRKGNGTVENTDTNMEERTMTANAKLEKATFTVKASANGKAVTLSNPISGKTIEDVVKTYGEKYTLELINASFVIVLQRVARAALNNGASLEDTQAAVNSYKPGQPRAAASKAATVASMSIEELEAALKAKKEAALKAAAIAG